LKARRACDLPALRLIFLFGIFGTPSRELVKGQLQWTHNLKIIEKE
jgi:hypothetical protein